MSMPPGALQTQGLSPATCDSSTMCPDEVFYEAFAALALPQR